MYSDWNKDDFYSVLPAFCYLLYKLKTNLPTTRIICIFNNDLKHEIIDNCKIACEKFEVEKIELKNIEKLSGHPNKAGMSQIKEQVMNYLLLNKG